MPESPITLAASESLAELFAARWPAVAQAWPGTPAPRILPLGEFRRLLFGPPGSASEEANAGALSADHAGPVLIVLDEDDAAQLAYSLIDRLQLRLIPGVVLLPRVGPQERSLQSGGVMVAEHDADPRFLAHVLFALGERQTAVRGLARELSIVSRHQGGMRGEMSRIHDELNLAAAVQQELLPKSLPSGAGLDWAVLFRPASYVSGDIYDCVDLGQHRVGFFIADAVGHGVPAALMTMVLSRSLRTTRGGPAGIEPVPPGEVLASLNNDLLRSTRQTPRFATAVYGVIDARTRRVTLAGAGHPPPIRLHDGTAVQVNTEGPLLGVFENEPFSEASFTMQPGETLLLYSDGFETAFAPLIPPAGPPASSSKSGRPSGRGRDARPTDERYAAGRRYYDELTALPWPNGTSDRRLADTLLLLTQRLDEQAGSLHQIDDVTALAIHALDRRAPTARTEDAPGSAECAAVQS